MAPELTLRYLRALADLPHDRGAALSELETCFREADTPGPIEGPTRGRVLTTTLGYGLDAVTSGLGHLWMPWKGKTFDPEAKEGRNIFTSGFRPVQRVLWPGYDIDDPLGYGRYSTFPFTTWEGPSTFTPGGADVLKIDYEHPQSPWLIRDILDELVRIEENVYLGQALLRIRGRLHRVAWFELRPSPKVPGAGASSAGSPSGPRRRSANLVPPKGAADGRPP
jgi:hypothetical protein